MKILLWKFNTLWTHRTVTMEFFSISQAVIFKHERWPLQLRIVMGITFTLTDSGSQVYVDLTLLQSPPFRSNLKLWFSSLTHAVSKSVAGRMSYWGGQWSALTFTARQCTPALARSVSHTHTHTHARTCALSVPLGWCMRGTGVVLGL